MYQPSATYRSAPFSSIAEGSVSPAGQDNVPVIIETSHQRSVAFGLSPTATPDFTPAGKSALSLLIEQNRMLHTHALPAMETLYQQIVNTHNMVILTDANGVIVHSLGDDDFLEKANRVALQPGVAWSEQSRGTNAIGTAITEKVPTLVHADQHYLAANHFLTCSAAPITDHRGNVIGVLDVSSDQRSFHKHTMALVRMSALMIENQLFSATFEDAITVHFHARPEFIGTLMEGIASFTPGGRFLSANKNGLFQLGLSFAALQSHTFSSLFGLPVSALYDHYRTASPGLLNLCMHSGVRVYGRAQLRLSNSVFQHGFAASTDHSDVNATTVQVPASASHAANAARRLSGLRYLRTGDPQLELVIEKVNKVLGSKSITVNVELICATNHNLRERMAKGLFREDLYYRLNGLVVKLPPLRERTDLDTVVKKILATEAPDTRYTVAPDILRMFHQHKWPGNFRQLTNLLRTAIVMAGDEHEICLRHMPDDFLDDIEMTQATAASASTDRMIAAA
eukprot:gene20458-24549_t